MKIANIVLSVLILLLAAASAVFSYFLFEKRSQFVSGWGQLVQTIANSAAELDQKSGSNYAKDLTPQTLAHEKYSELAQHLPKLIEQSKLIIKERNTMGERLHRIGNNINMKDLPALEALLSLDSYEGKTSAIEGAVGVFVDHRNSTYNHLINFARSELSVKIKNDDLESGSEAPFSEMKDSLSTQRQKIKAYESCLNRLSAELGLPSPEFKNIKKAADSSVEKIQKYRIQKKDLEQQLRTLQKEKNKLTGELEKSREQIEKQRKNIAGLQLQLNDCKRALGIPAGGKKLGLWAAGSDEARNKLSGHVTEVSPEYGYVIIDLGSTSTVSQRIGKKLVEVPLNITNGMELVIMRYNKENAPEFVSRVTVDQVNLYSLTANIPAGSKTIAVGDLVCFIKHPEDKKADPKEDSKAVPAQTEKSRK